jgi:hypothetical protein
MAEKVTIEKILPPGPRESARDGASRRRGPRQGKAEPGRWVREAKGILALALAGFGFVALYAYDPMVHPLDQSSPVGPVGAWLGWGSFQAFGYAGYLFPVLLALYGVSAFVRPRVAHGWQAGSALILLVSATGILAAPPTRWPSTGCTRGGVVGGVRRAMAIGTWAPDVPLLIPVGVPSGHAHPVGALARCGRASDGCSARRARRARGSPARGHRWSCRGCRRAAGRRISQPPPAIV